MKSLRSKIKLTLINLLVFLGLLLLVELGMNLMFRLTSNQGILNYASVNQLNGQNLKPQYSPHRYLGYYPSPNWEKGNNAHNSLGFRGPEIDLIKSANAFRIVCIGGSTTYTTGVENFRKSYPYLLEKELHKQGFKNVEVINSGVGNWSTWESMINLQLRLLDLKPDLIVVYHATNDIQSRIVWPPKVYQGDNTGRRQSSFSDLSPGWKEVLLESSNILRVLAIKTQLKIPNTALEKLDSSPDSYYLPEFIQQLKKGTYPSGQFKQVPVSEMLDRNKPVYFRRNLANIIELAQGNGIEVLLATFAHCSQFKDEFSSTKEYEQAYQEHNEVIKSVAQEKQVPWFDYANLFPNDSTLYVDGRHVNEKGSMLKAQIFTRYIRMFLDGKTNNEVISPIN